MMDEPTVVVGRITRAHGVTGEVAVLVISEVPGRFADGATVWLEDGRTLTVESSRPHKDRLLVRFRGVEDRAQAEALQRALLDRPRIVVPRAAPGLVVGSPDRRLRARDGHGSRARDRPRRDPHRRERRLVGRRRRRRRDPRPGAQGCDRRRGHGREADRRPRDPGAHGTRVTLLAPRGARRRSR